MAFFFFLVVTIMLAFVVLYRRRKGQTHGRRPHAQHAAGDLLDRHPAGHRHRLLRRRPAVLRRSGIAAGGGRRGRRRGQPMAVQFQVSQRGRIERAVPPGRSAGGAEAHLQGRHPRPLHPGLPRAAQRRAGAEHGDLVQADGANRQGSRHRRGEFLSRLLHAVLRQRPCRNEHQGLRAEQGRLRQEAGRGGQHLRRQEHASSRCRMPRSARSSTPRWAAPSATRSTGPKGTGPTWKGLYKRDRRVLEVQRARLHAQGERRRQEVGRLPPRVDPPPGGQDRAGLPERHASPGVGIQRIAVQREEARRPSSSTSRAWEIPSTTSR